jgi:hypothetical protein
VPGLLNLQDSTGQTGGTEQIEEVETEPEEAEPEEAEPEEAALKEAEGQVLD